MEQSTLLWKALIFLEYLYKKFKKINIKKDLTWQKKYFFQTKQETDYLKG